MKIYLTKLQNILIYFISRLSIYFITLSSNSISRRTLLLIRLDLIGDYILFRNFIHEVKEHYIDYKITLCGNSAWKDLSEWLDSEEITNFIWIDRKKFYRNIIYKTSLLNKIYRSGFEVVINPTFTREILYGDLLVYISKAAVKTGSSGSPDGHAQWKRNLLTDKYYTNLIPAESENLFEFYRNKEFFEKALNKTIDIKKPSIPYSKILNRQIKNNYIVFVSGASEIKRRWNIRNFAEVARHILMNSNLEIVIAGSSDDKYIADEFLNLLSAHKSRIYNNAGKTTLPQFVELLAFSEFLVSNETSSIHFAAALDKSFICISNGNHYGRFNPYPDGMVKNSYYIYPEEIEKFKGEHNEPARIYRFGSDLDVNSINIDKVISRVELLMEQLIIRQ